MSAQQCPVCCGCGLVQSNFYQAHDVVPWGFSDSAIPQRQTCRTCGGMGAVVIDGTMIHKLTPAVDLRSVKPDVIGETK